MAIHCRYIRYHANVHKLRDNLVGQIPPKTPGSSAYYNLKAGVLNNYGIEAQHTTAATQSITVTTSIRPSLPASASVSKLPQADSSVTLSGCLEILELHCLTDF